MVNFNTIEQELSQLFLKGLLTESDRDNFRMTAEKVCTIKSNVFELQSIIVSVSHRHLNNIGMSDSVFTMLQELLEIVLSARFTVQHSTVLFSPEDDCTEMLIDFIKSSENKIEICVFTITDDRIASAILSAHSHRKKIRIITDNEKAYDSGSDIRKFAHAGIPVKVDVTSQHMHNKFAIADDSLLLTGSFNWTRTAAEHNRENILITPDEYIVHSFVKQFQYLWQNCQRY